MFNNKYIHRRFFLFFDKLQIKKGERNVICSVVVLLVTIHFFIQINSFANSQTSITNHDLEKNYVKGVHQLIMPDEQYRRYYVADNNNFSLLLPSKVMRLSLHDTIPALPDKDKKSIVLPDSVEKKINNGLDLINKGEVAMLEQIPGIGKVTANKIIIYREQHGPFKTIDDLIKIKGIGVKKLAKIRAYLENKEY